MNIYSQKEHIPYVYEIQHKKSLKKYIGVRFGKGCHPEELLKKNGYKTSSSVIHEIIKEEGLNSFEILSIETFDNNKDAQDREIELLKSVQANRNEDYFNKAISKAIINDEETQRLIIEKGKKTIIEKYGVIHCMYLDKTKEKIKQVMLSKYGVEYSGQTEKSRKLSSEHMKRISQIIKVCPHCEVPIKGAGAYKYNHGDKCLKNPYIKNEKRVENKDTHCKFCEKVVSSRIHNQFHGEYCKENPNRVKGKTIICEFCDEEVSPSIYAMNHGKYCSNNPNRATKPQNEYTTCEHCNKKVTKSVHKRLHGVKCKGK